MTAQDAARTVHVVRHLVDARITNSGLPLMPSGLREEVVSVLSLCLANADLMVDYLSVLSAELESRGVFDSLPIRPSRPIPEAIVVTQGVAGVDDETLADVAINPAVLGLLSTAIELSLEGGHDDIPTPGPWLQQYFDMDYGLVSDSPAATVSTPTVASPDEPPRARPRANTWWYSGVAAAMLVAAGIGYTVGRLGVTSDDRVAVVSSSPVAVQPQGGDEVRFDVKLTSDRVLFATLVVPLIDGSLSALPIADRDPIRVGPSESPAVGSITLRPGQAVLVVFTETPATDLVRRVVASAPAGAKPTDIQDAVRAKLAEYNHRNVGFSTATAPNR